jgi:hypothetical protein
MSVEQNGHYPAEVVFAKAFAEKFKADVLPVIDRLLLEPEPYVTMTKAGLKEDQQKFIGDYLLEGLGPQEIAQVTNGSAKGIALTIGNGFDFLRLYYDNINDPIA